MISDREAIVDAIRKSRPVVNVKVSVTGVTTRAISHYETGIVSQLSRWNRVLTPLARIFRLNYFWYWDEARGRRRLWIGRAR